MNTINFNGKIKTSKIETIETNNNECDSVFNDTKEILCDGYFYDVTNFIDRHPGGKIIKYYTQNGEDATHAIQQFHQRSIEQVRNMMKAFKRRPASDKERMNCKCISLPIKLIFLSSIFQSDWMRLC